MIEFYKILIPAVLVYVNIYVNYAKNEEFCDIEEKSCKNQEQKVRYLFYDVNPPEGFNLRRDVYLRFAVFAYSLQRSLNKDLSSFKLVLPPWVNLYHWRTETEQTPWSHFFDLKSLQQFAPVIEMHQFFDEINPQYSQIKIDEVYVLQHFEDMFKTGKFEDKMEIQKCNRKIETKFYEYDNVTSDNIKCLSFHGHASQLTQILSESDARTVMFDHGEVALHDSFGSQIYWEARRSMRFSKELHQVADEFRKKHLNSSDISDNTKLSEDWKIEKLKRNAKGGPYLAVHLRRRDFARGRPNDVPSIPNAAKQIIDLLTKLNLKKVFIATDAPNQEYEKLNELLAEFEIYRFKPDIKTKFKAGQLAIIDQIICSYAKYFVGTHESTFSFRIQEEREIIGFQAETTFNRLCGDNPNYKCEKPSIWKIVY